MAIFTVPILIATNPADNTRASGAKLYTRITGTNTPTATYSDAALTTPHTNPIVADSDGVFPAIYIDPDVIYRLILTDGSDAGNDPDQETNLWQDVVDNYGVFKDTTGYVTNYDITFFSGDAVPSNGQYFGRQPVTRDSNLPVNAAGSKAVCRVKPTAAYACSIMKNDTTVGTVTFSTTTTLGAFVVAASTAFAAASADTLGIKGAATADATVRHCGVTIRLNL